LLGKYRVEKVVGEGGMGAVLEGFHIDLEETVAIKVLLPEMMDRQEIVQRFLREAKAAVKLKGEHVARVLDVGRLDADVDGNFEGVPYIVMELLHGSDLNAIIKAYGPQDPVLAVDLMLQACEAIAEAHSIGIIHRDIKASNFFVSQHEGAPPTLKVLDFGIATTPKGTSDLTDGGQVIGTPSYMAPEQMRSSRLADARSDIWSLGVVLYEMLEGKRPFRSETYSDLCLKVGMDPPEPMVQPNVPEGLRAIVLRCLEKPVERRYQSVAELAFDLMPFASDPVLARASVEQCARLLSRRSTRSIDIARAPDDLTPGPHAPPRLTPPAHRAIDTGGFVKEPLSSSDSRPHPAPRNTPTSIQMSHGEVAATAAPPRRGLVMMVSFVIAIVLAGGGVLLFSRSSQKHAAAQPPQEEYEPAQQMQVVPTNPAPVAADAAVADPAGSATEPVTPPKTSPKHIKKRR
jgi:serine/threonine-protein kinase